MNNDLEKVFMRSPFGLACKDQAPSIPVGGTVQILHHYYEPSNFKTFSIVAGVSTGIGQASLNVVGRMHRVHEEPPVELGSWHQVQVIQSGKQHHDLLEHPGVARL